MEYLQEKQSHEELIRLMQENPELPILPFVDAEIAADDVGYWAGSWGNVKIDEYLFPPNDAPVLFKSDDDVFDVLERYLTDEEFEALPDSEEDCRPIYDSLPWKKAIIVYIELPD